MTESDDIVTRINENMSCEFTCFCLFTEIEITKLATKNLPRLEKYARLRKLENPRTLCAGLFIKIEITKRTT